MKQLHKKFKKKIVFMTWQKNLDQPFITVTLATVELVAPSESVTVNLDIKISQCLLFINMMNS